MAHLSYFELALTEYITNHHPEKITDKDFIKARAEYAENTFQQVSHEGETVEEAWVKANRVLYQGLVFSPYDEISDIIDEYFPEVEKNERHLFIMQMMELNENVSKKYPLEDDSFGGSYEYQQLHNELIGNILIYIEKNGLQ